MTRQRSSASILILALASLMSGGCAGQPEPQPDSLPQVQVTEARRGDIVRIIDADGTLRALDQSAVTPKISAPVRQFLVDRGDYVPAGELLAVLENADLQAVLDEAKAAYEQADANYRTVSMATVPDSLVRAQANLDAAAGALEAARRLQDSRLELLEQGAIASRLADEANVSFTQAKGQYDTARRNLESVQGVAQVEDIKTAAAQRDSARARTEAAQVQLGYSEIRSPISGIVSDRPLFVGEMAVPGMPLVTVVDISSLIARVNVPSGQARYITVGQPAGILLGGGSEAPGRVIVVSPAVDPQGTTVEVWIRTDNPDERLRPGGTVHARITAAAVHDAVVVPISALLPSSEGGTAVFTVGPDMIAHERPVQVGVRTDQQAEVLSGLDAGTEVVVAGGLGLTDGARVVLQAGSSDGSDPGVGDPEGGSRNDAGGRQE